MSNASTAVGFASSVQLLERFIERFIEAHEQADVATAAAMLRDDARIAMPPHSFWFAGREQILQSLVVGLREPGERRLLATGANRQPAAASYLRPKGDMEFRAFKLDVIPFEGGLVAEITTFDASLFPAFGLLPTLNWVGGGHALRPEDRSREATWETRCEIMGALLGTDLDTDYRQDRPTWRVDGHRSRWFKSAQQFGFTLVRD